MKVNDVISRLSTRAGNSVNARRGGDSSFQFGFRLTMHEKTYLLQESSKEFFGFAVQFTKFLLSEICVKPLRTAAGAQHLRTVRLRFVREHRRRKSHLGVHVSGFSPSVYRGCKGRFECCNTREGELGILDLGVWGKLAGTVVTLKKRTIFLVVITVLCCP